MKDGADNLERNISNIDAEYHVDRAKRVANKAGNAARSVFSAFSRVFGIALIIGAIGMIVLMASVLTGTDVFITFSDDHNITSLSYGELSEIIFSSAGMADWAFTAILLLVGVPLIYAFVAGIKLSFKMEGSLRVFGIITTIFIIAGATIGFFVGIDTGKQFGQDAEVVEVLKITQPTTDTLTIDLIDDEVFSSHFSDHDDYFFELIEVGDEKITLGNAYLDIKESHTDSFEIVAVRSSQGPTQKEAIRMAEAMDIAWEQTDSSTVSFSPNFILDKEDKFRGQHLEYIVKVPQGKAVRIAPLMDRIIYDVKNASHTPDSKMVGKIWTMTSRGLTCIGCNI